MEETFEVKYTRKALQDIDHVERYITQRGYPDTAVNYTTRILNYLKTLQYLPERSTICKYPAFQKRGFRCAIFEKTYVIVYRVKANMVEVLRLIHGKRLNY